MNKNYLTISGFASFAALSLYSTSFAATCNPDIFYFHANGGGRINQCAKVADSAYIYQSEIEAGVTIGENSRVENSHVFGRTVIEQNCEIDNSYINHSSIKAGAIVDNSHLTKTEVQSSSKIDNSIVIDSTVQASLEIDNSTLIDVIVSSPIGGKSYLAVDNSNLIHVLVKPGSIINLVNAIGESKGHKKEI